MSLEPVRMPFINFNGGKAVDAKNVKVDPFEDQKVLLELTEEAFARAARKASAENDALGIPTPVGVRGRIIHVLRNRLLKHHVLEHSFLKK